MLSLDVSEETGEVMIDGIVAYFTIILLPPQLGIIF